MWQQRQRYGDAAAIQGTQWTDSHNQKPRRCKEGFYPKSQRKHDLLTPRFQTSRLQNYERIRFFCSKLRGLWYFVVFLGKPRKLMQSSIEHLILTSTSLSAIFTLFSHLSNTKAPNALIFPHASYPGMIKGIILHFNYLVFKHFPFISTITSLILALITVHLDYYAYDKSVFHKYYFPYIMSLFPNFQQHPTTDSKGTW